MRAAAADTRIRPWLADSHFWQYRGEPVLLLGGSVDDNLFQIPDLEAHLDLLVAAGGNYVRNTMSDRLDLGYEVTAFGRRADGRYDLARWNEEYWARFARFLELTAARDVFVQIEMWDRFDHSRGPWLADPYNPKNNVNYSCEASGLAPDYPSHPLHNEQPFFYTVPALQDNRVVRPFQQAFVDRVLSLTLRHRHILYCIDNETSGDPAWGRYWAEYIREAAAAAGTAAEVTQMWDAWDLRHEMHRLTLDHPELYSFVDLSQNSHNPGDANWDRAQWVRRYLADRPRPMNATKIYGADTSTWTGRGITSAHGGQTFWRNLIGGFASSRFHRPPAGLGLSAAAQAHLRSARLLAAVFDFFHAVPDSAHELLAERKENEAFLTRVPGQQYAVYFTDGGYVELDLSEAAGGTLRLRWLDIAASRWQEAGTLSAKEPAPLPAPGSGPWVALLTRA